MTARGAVQMQLVSEPVEALTITARILLLWRMRPCFLCGVRGICDHRERDIALAEIAAEDARQARDRARLTVAAGRGKR